MANAYKSPEWKSILKKNNREDVIKRVRLSHGLQNFEEEEKYSDLMEHLMLPPPAPSSIREQHTDMFGKKEKEAELAKKSNDKNLFISFVLMLGIGLGNRIFQKLQTIPMYNYPNFLNLLTTFMYIPLSFAYIIPMHRHGRAIDDDQYYMSKKPFVIMGFLDSLAGIMQVFASTYLDGSLLVLLSQASIPISMVISRWLLKARYTISQLVGALIVTLGIFVVLAPSLNKAQGEGSTEVLWSGVMILSTLPMTLSSVYKEVVLDREMDPVFLNGWTAVFQFIFSIFLAIPAALAGNPPVSPLKLPENLWHGLLCYFGKNSVHTGPHQDNCLPAAPVFVTLYLFFNVAYNILMVLILKYGSANILFLSSTIMVPLGHVAFALPFMPQHNFLEISDLMGLGVIMSGLVVYRFGKIFCRTWSKDELSTSGDDSKSEPLLQVEADGSLVSKVKKPNARLFTTNEKTVLEFMTSNNLPDTRQDSLDYI